MIIVRYLSLVVVLALYALILAGKVQAQDHAPDEPRPARLRPLEALLAFDLARVCINESMGNEADCAMIWQTVRARAPGARGRRAWLRAHSRCVTGGLTQAEAERRRGPCRWTRNLRPDGSRPEGWPDGPSWHRMRARWRATMRLAFQLVAGRTVLLVCPEDPRTWDGRAWAEQARARGWRALDCKGTRNVGYVSRGG